MLVRSELINAKALALVLKRTSPRTNRVIARELLTQLAEKTAARASKVEIKRGGKGAPLPDRLTSRSGSGRRSIGVNLLALPRFAEVGSDLGYMELHEKGGTVKVGSSTVKAHTRRFAFGKKQKPFDVPSFKRRSYTYKLPARKWLEPAVDYIVRNVAPQLAVKILERHAKAVGGR